MRKVIVSVGFHGLVDFTWPVSLSGSIINTAKILSLQGYNFKIFCESKGRKYQVNNNLKNIALYAYFNKFFSQETKFYQWHKILWISYKLANSCADVIHIHQNPGIVIGYYLLKNMNSPVIFHINSHPGGWKKISRLEKAVRKSNLVIAASRFVENSLIKRFHFLKGKTEVLYNGVDTKIFSPTARNEGLKLKESGFTVFFAGNIWLEKGFDVLLKAAQELKKENVKFLIAGNFAPEKFNLHKEFKKKTPENVKYLGGIKHDDLAQYFASSDITIVPSRWEEPFGMVIIESMACGTAVIGSNIGGIPELIDDGRNGLLVTPGSEKELVDAILWCKKHPDRLKEMGIEARKKSLKFDWKILSKQLKKIYEGLLTKKKLTGDNI